MMKQALLLTVTVLLLGACASAKGPMAMATLSPTTSGSTAQGTVHFQELADGAVEVQVDLTGVPAGTHGFHVHEFGSCANNGEAAGGHFNPTNQPHASPEAVSHHAGDFGNVTADANGEVHTRFTTRSIMVSTDIRSVVGKAVILHANRDDLTTQPTGNAGGRIACGVAQLHDAGSMRP
jgi:superoxide dismutase, Cu-Zn family